MEEIGLGIEPSCMTEAEARSALAHYLQQKHTSNWPPMNWEIAKYNRRQEAVNWFVSVCKDIGIVVEDVKGDPLPNPPQGAEKRKPF